MTGRPAINCEFANHVLGAVQRLRVSLRSSNAPWPDRVGVGLRAGAHFAASEARQGACIALPSTLSRALLQQPDAMADAMARRTFHDQFDSRVSDRGHHLL